MNVSVGMMKEVGDVSGIAIYLFALSDFGRSSSLTPVSSLLKGVTLFLLTPESSALSLHLTPKDAHK